MGVFMSVFTRKHQDLHCEQLRAPIGVVFSIHKDTHECM